MGWLTGRSSELVRLNETLVASFQKVKSDVHNVHEWIRFLYEQNKYQAGLINQAAQKLQEAHSNLPTRQDIKVMVHDEVRSVKEDIRQEIQKQVRHDIHNSQLAIQSTVRRRVAELVYEQQTGVFQRLQDVQQQMHELASKTPEDHSNEIFERLRTMESKFENMRAPVQEVTSEKTDKVFERLGAIMEKLEERSVQPAPQPIPQPAFTQYPPPEINVSNLQRKIMKRVQRNSKQYVKQVLENTIRKYERMPGLQIKEMIVDEQGLVSKSSLYRLLNELEEEGIIVVQQDGKEKIYSASEGPSAIEEITKV